MGIWFWNKSPEPAPTQTVEKLSTPVSSENRRTIVPLLEDKATEDNEDNFFDGSGGNAKTSVEKTVTQVTESPNETENITITTEVPMPIQLTETENDSIYIVKPNDTLGKVFGERWRDIAAYNQIESPYVIFVGQRIKVP